MAITDKLRFTVIKANTNEILARDLVVQNPQVVRNLSAPSYLQFTVPQGEALYSSKGIDWKAYGQWVVVEMEINHVKTIFANTIVTDTTVDQATGNMSITAKGILAYAKGIPWLVDFNPIAVDPFEVVQRIWAHLESFSNANLNVTVTPASSGTQMIPGYGYDGETLSFNFYAIFIRSVDFNDCNDYMTALARDIPFDIVEDAAWNDDKTVVNNFIRLGYPEGGFQQNDLTFQLGVNVIQAQQSADMDIQSVSDVIVRSWLPGKVYSAQISNADIDRLRRTVMEEDANIESDERAAAWAGRKLTRRNIPNSFKTIVIDPNHTNAPAGSFDVGDSIYIEAQNYPWVGPIAQWHRILQIAYDDSKGLMQLQVKVDGAFNYDPIEYDPDYDDQPTKDANRLSNGYFQNNLSGWVAIRGEWIRDTELVYSNPFETEPGSVRIDCDDQGDDFESHTVPITPGEHIDIIAALQYENVTSNNAPGFILRGVTSYNGDLSVGDTYDLAHITNPQGISGWLILEKLNWIVPAAVNEMSIHLVVTPDVLGGTAWWTYVRVVTTGQEGPQ